MYINISRLPLVLFRLALSISMAFLLVSCGGGGSGGGGGGNTTLFEDNFDFLISSSNWTGSGGGTAEHDPAIGFPDPGSMKMSGDSKAQASGTFSVANGLEIYVRVLIPDSNIADTGTQTGLMVEIESTELGTGSAHVAIWRSPCSSAADHTRFEYFIQAPSGGGNTQSYENFNCTFAPDDRFVDFGFIVHPDGTSEWRRDGVIMRSFGSHFGSGGVKLNLHGGGTILGTVPGFYLWYDDVWVGR